MPSPLLLIRPHLSLDSLQKVGLLARPAGGAVGKNGQLVSPVTMDTSVNTDYFSLFTFHKIINIWKLQKYFEISNCGFGLELNASCNNVKIVPTGEMLFAGIQQTLINICGFFLHMLFHQLVQFLHLFLMHF